MGIVIYGLDEPKLFAGDFRHDGTLIFFFPEDRTLIDLNPRQLSETPKGGLPKIRRRPPAGRSPVGS